MTRFMTYNILSKNAYAFTNNFKIASLVCGLEGINRFLSVEYILDAIIEIDTLACELKGIS